MLVKVSARYLQRLDHRQAVHWLERLAESDRYDGEACWQVMAAYLALGDRRAALQHYHAHREALEELGLSPSSGVHVQLEQVLGLPAKARHEPPPSV